MQSNFNVETHNGTQAVVIGVSGELDLASSPALEQELERGAAAKAEVVIVDLRNLEFMDSTGLSVLVRAHQRATENGQRFGVVKGPQQVQRLLSLTGVADRLTLADSPDELLSRRAEPPLWRARSGCGYAVARARWSSITMWRISAPLSRRTSSSSLSRRSAEPTSSESAAGELGAGAGAQRPDHQLQAAGVGAQPEAEPGRAGRSRRVGGDGIGDQIDVGEAIQGEAGPSRHGPRQASQDAADEGDRGERDDRIAIQTIAPAVLRAWRASGTVYRGRPSRSAANFSHTSVPPSSQGRNAVCWASARMIGMPTPWRRSSEGARTGMPRP